MANISINNGRDYCTASEALDALGMDILVQYMDDDTREAVHADIAPCTDLEFLSEYLRRASDDIIIG